MIMGQYTHEDQILAEAKLDRLYQALLREAKRDKNSFKGELFTKDDLMRCYRVGLQDGGRAAFAVLHNTYHKVMTRKTS